MRLVKIFKSREDETGELEDQVNQWILETGVEVVSFDGTIAPQSQTSHPSRQPMASDVLLVVTYEPASTLAENQVAAAR